MKIPDKLEFGNYQHIELRKRYEMEHANENEKYYVVTRERMITIVEEADVLAHSEEDAIMIAETKGDDLIWEEAGVDPFDCKVTGATLVDNMEKQ